MLNMIVIVLALTFSGLMQLCNVEIHVCHSDLYIIEKSAIGCYPAGSIRRISFGSGPVRVDDIVVYQQKCAQRAHQRRH